MNWKRKILDMHLDAYQLSQISLILDTINEKEIQNLKYFLEALGEKASREEEKNTRR